MMGRVVAIIEAVFVLAMWVLTIDAWIVGGIVAGVFALLMAAMFSAFIWAVWWEMWDD